MNRISAPRRGRPADRFAFAGAWIAGLLGVGVGLVRPIAFDAHVYWAAWPLYVRPPALESTDVFVYPPPFAQLLWPVHLLPFPMFFALWTGLAAAIFAWALWPLPLRYRIPCFLACTAAIAMGNIEALLVAVIVLGLRRPGLWALPLLTKMTPGVAVGWFAGRRDWRAVGEAVASATAIALLSFLLAPDLWAAYVRFLGGLLEQDASGYFFAGILPPISLVVRTALGGVLVLWGGFTGRAWTMPVAMVLAQPDASWATLSILAAIPRLRQAVPSEAPRILRPASPPVADQVTSAVR